MNYFVDFDWLANPKIVINLLISTAVAGLGGMAIIYFADSTASWHALLAGGFGPAITTFFGRLSKSPIQEHKEKIIAEKILNGEFPDRRRHREENIA